MIDKYSATWQAVERFIDKELEDAIQSLIADQDSDQQRGAIHVLNRLADLVSDPIEQVVSDHYN